MPRKDRQDLAGVLGAFGHRVNGTAGYCKENRPGMGLVLEVNWKGDQFHYRLRSAMRTVLDEMNPEWLNICEPNIDIEE